MQAIISIYKIEKYVGILLYPRIKKGVGKYEPKSINSKRIIGKEKTYR